MTQPKHITPDELDELVAGPCDCPARSGTRRAAATIRALLEERDEFRKERGAAHARAEKAEAALDALRAEMPDCDACEIHLREHLTADRDGWKAEFLELRKQTADLLEIERCKASIEEAKWSWSHDSWRRNGDKRALKIVNWSVSPCFYRFGAQGQPATVDDWQAAERAAWEHAAEPYRKRIEAAGWPVLCITPRGNCGPITIEGPAYRIKCFGEPYGSPTLDALEQAAQWAEAHPAGEIRDCSRCLHGQLGGPPPGNPCWNGLNCGFDAKPEPDVKPPATPHPANAPSTAQAQDPQVVIANFDDKHRELRPDPQGEVNIGGARYTVVEGPPESCCPYCGKPDHD